MNKDRVELIINMIKNFITGYDRSLLIASKIEVELDELFPDNEEIQDFVTCFASYRPGGGELLYNEDEMVMESKTLLKVLQSVCDEFK